MREVIFYDSIFELSLTSTGDMVWRYIFECTACPSFLDVIDCLLACLLGNFNSKKIINTSKPSPIPFSVFVVFRFYCLIIPFE